MKSIFKHLLFVCLLLGLFNPSNAFQTCDPGVTCPNNNECQDDDNTKCCIPVTDPQCAQFQLSPTGTGCIECGQCNNGYYLTNAICEDCTILFSDCTQCEPSGCLVCGNGKKLQGGECVNSCGLGYYDDLSPECQQCNTFPSNIDDSQCIDCDINGCISYCDTQYPLLPGKICKSCNEIECTNIDCTDVNASYNSVTDTCDCNVGYFFNFLEQKCECDQANNYKEINGICETCDFHFSGKNQIEQCITCDPVNCQSGTCETTSVNSGQIRDGACKLCQDYQNANLVSCTSCDADQCLTGECVDNTLFFDSSSGTCFPCFSRSTAEYTCLTCELQGNDVNCLSADCTSAGNIYDPAQEACITCNDKFVAINPSNNLADCSSCNFDKCLAGTCVDPATQEFNVAQGKCITKCDTNQYFDGTICVACSDINIDCVTCNDTPLCLTVDCSTTQYEIDGATGKECVNCNEINNDCTKCRLDQTFGPICEIVSCNVQGTYQKIDQVTQSVSCGNCSDFDDPLKPDEICNSCTAAGCDDRDCPSDSTFKTGGVCNQCNDVAFFGPNCLTCNINTCLTNDCSENSYYDQDSKACVACSNNWSNSCLTCDKDSCLTNNCPVGTFYSQTERSCIACEDTFSGGIENCAECEDAQTTTTCTNCYSGYVVDNTGISFCDECSNKYTGLDGTCLTCDASNCLTIQCSNGYYQNSLSCTLCTDTYSDNCETCDAFSCQTFCPAGQVNALPCTNCWDFHQESKALTCTLEKTESSCLPGFVPLSGACVQCSTAVSDDTCAECHPVDYTTAACDLNCVAGEYAYLGKCESCADKFGDSCATCSFSTCTLNCNTFQTAENGACVDKTCQEVYGIRCLICDFGLDLCTTTCAGGFYVDASTNPDTCVDCTTVHGNDCAACDDAITCSLDCSTLPGTHPVGGLCCNSNETEINGQCVACSTIFGDDCLTCDNNECTGCKTSSFPFGPTCIPCSIFDNAEQCATCDEINLCTQYCPAGQYAEDGLCKPCSDYGNCALCDALDCNLPCAIYEYPENGGCQQCFTAIPGCATCTGSDLADCTLLCIAPEVPAFGICCLSNQYNDNGACADCTAAHGPFCETCTGASTCDTCRFGKDAVSGLCIEQCELNQFGIYPDCTDCSTINANCQTCTDATTCTLCQDADGNQQFINGLDCVDSCPAGTFDAGSFICQNCSSGCLACNDATSCTDCGTGNYFNSATPACEVCPTSLGAQCTACSIDGTACTDCGAGNYFNSITGSCDICSNSLPECQTCSIDGTTCDTCNDRYEWNGTQCAEIPCTVTDCSTCEADINVCEACGNNKVLDLDSNTCVDSCGDGRFNNNGICDDCVQDCKTCSNELVCEDCGNNYLKADGSCTADCGDYYFADGLSTPKACVSCADAHCLTCSSGNTGDCQTCENGWFDDGNGGCTDVSPQPCAGLCQPWTNRIYKKGEQACKDNRCFTAKYETRLNFDEPEICSWSAYWTVNYDITCATACQFDKTKVYNTGQFVIYHGSCWKAKWQNTAQWWDGNIPGKGNSWTKQ